LAAEAQRTFQEGQNQLARKIQENQLAAQVERNKLEAANQAMSLKIRHADNLFKATSLMRDRLEQFVARLPKDLNGQPLPQTPSQTAELINLQEEADKSKLKWIKAMNAVNPDIQYGVEELESGFERRRVVERQRLEEAAARRKVGLEGAQIRPGATASEQFRTVEERPTVVEEGIRPFAGIGGPGGAMGPGGLLGGLQTRPGGTEVITRGGEGIDTRISAEDAAAIQEERAAQALLSGL
jgi:hypothetical protein